MASGVFNPGWNPQRNPSQVVASNYNTVQDYKPTMGAGADGPFAPPASGQPSDILNAAYGRILHRAPDAAGTAYFTPLVQSGSLDLSGVENSMRQSPEYMLDTAYQALLQRGPDAAGTAYFGPQIESGSLDRSGLENSIRQSPEYAQLQASQAATRASQAAAQANTSTQQQAYNQQTGGGYTGGILDAAKYAQPFGNTITGGAGLMGAPTTAAASTGLNPTGPASPNPFATGFGSAGLQSSPSAWGGAFSYQNPWSVR